MAPEAGEAAMSKRDQITLSVGAMLLLSLFLTFGAYMAGRQTRQNADTLSTQGVTVEGRITNKVERFGGVVNGPKYTWWLDVAYTTKDGQTLTDTIGVDESVYRSTVVGPVKVTYISTTPKVFFIAGVHDSVNHSEADTETVDTMTYYGIVASAVLGFVLVALLVTRNGGGSAPQPQVQAPDISRRLPGQFGRRA